MSWIHFYDLYFTMKCLKSNIFFKTYYTEIFIMFSWHTVDIFMKYYAMNLCDFFFYDVLHWHFYGRLIAQYSVKLL